MFKIFIFALKAGPLIIWNYLSWIIRYSRHPEKYSIEVRYNRVRKLVLKLLKRFNVVIKGENEYLIQDNQRVILGGILAEVNQKVTRNNSIMAFLKLEDLTGVIEVVVFPKTLDKVRNLINLDSMVVINGRVNIKEDEEPKLICESIEPLEKVNSDKVYIRVDDLQMAKAMKQKLIDVVSEYKGDSALYVFTANDRKNYRMPRDMWVDLNSEVVFELKKVFGDSNVKVVE